MSLRSRIEKLETSPSSEAASVWGATMPRYWDDVPTATWDDRCICFPVQPSFNNELELEKARALKCPLHGERFTQYEPISWSPRWVRDRWLEDDFQPEESPSTKKHWHAQYEKALLATFPLGFLPVKEWFENDQNGMRIQEVTIAEWLALEEAEDRSDVARNAITTDQASRRTEKRRERFKQWL